MIIIIIQLHFIIVIIASKNNNKNDDDYYNKNYYDMLPLLMSQTQIRLKKSLYMSIKWCVLGSTGVLSLNQQ